jgi:uncharacterized membrane protein
MVPGVRFIARTACLVLVLSLILTASLVTSQAEPVVHVVMFYSSSCIHCQQVIQEVLPPLRQEFDPQLDLLLLDVANPQMSSLLSSACEVYAVEADLCGNVPTVIIGPHILIGSNKVSDQLAALIREGLTVGGIPLPDIPGMQAAYDYIQSFRTNQPEGATLLVEQPSASLGQRFLAAPVATGLMLLTLGLLVGSPAWLWRRYSTRSRAYRDGTLAIVGLSVLVALSLIDLSNLPTVANAVAATNLAILLGVGGLVIQPESHLPPARPRLQMIGLPALLLGSLLLSAYMAYLEIAHHEAYCGPIGDCLRVQQGQYAWLFGWLPVGGLGVAGAVTLLAGWIIFQQSAGPTRFHMGRLLAGLLGFGVLFSAYLTCVELFVIGTMCAWCLTSALLMLLMFWIYWPTARVLRLPHRQHP